MILASRAAAWVLTSSLSPQQAPTILPPGVPLAVAAPARPLQVGALQDLGTWEEAYAPGDADCLVLHRGQEWFRLPAGDGASPLPWFTAPELAHAQLLPRTSWQKLVLVSATGDRGAAEAPVDPEHPRALKPVCLFASGRLLLRRELGPDAVQLCATLLRLPE